MMNPILLCDMLTRLESSTDYRSKLVFSTLGGISLRHTLTYVESFRMSFESI